MAMFGNTRKGLFQNPPPLTTPGIGDGLPGQMEPGRGYPMAMPEPQPAQASKFGARDVIGIIGEALGGAAGNGPGAYTQGKMREREMAQQQQTYQQRQQDERNEWLFRAGWERDNPKPSAPHYWETNDGSLGTIGPDGKPTILFKDPTPKTETIQVRDPSTGEVKWYRVPQGGGDPAVSPSPGAASNRPAIGSVVPDPRKGGGAGNGTGGFRP